MARTLDVQPRFRVFVTAGKDEFSKRFEDFPVKDNLLFWYQNPDPTGIATARTKDVKLDDFLGMPTTWSDESTLSVRDMIDYVANVGGGIHKGKARPGSAEAIHKAVAGMPIQFNGMPFPVDDMRSIINMALEGLLPLYWRLKA